MRCTTSIASDCRLRDRRNLGDSKRLKRKKRQININMVKSPRQAMKYRQPRLSLELQQGCWPPVIEQGDRFGLHEYRGMKYQATEANVTRSPCTGRSQSSLTQCRKKLSCRPPGTQE